MTTVTGGHVVAATANPKKLAEIEAIVGAAGSFALLPRPAGMADVDETGETLEENAALKAHATALAAGAPAIADDTGLEVDALDGAPGVRSARFAGEDAVDADNVALLLERLAGVPDDRRTARFRTVICVARPDGQERFAEGVCEGRIVAEPRGDAGFGYDPVFVPDDGDGRTFAEMSAAEKHGISHRGRAVRAAGERFAAFLAERPQGGGVGG